jgi:hypothetical protein
LKPRDLDKILSTTEQCLCACGILEPGHCRAKGAVPQGLIAKVSADLKALLDEWQAAIEKVVKEKKDKLVWSDAKLAAYEDSLWKDLEKTLLDGLDKSLKAGLKDASSELGVEIKFSSIDKELITVLEKQQVNLSENIAAKVTGNAKQALLESQRLGENLSQAIDRLQKISTLTPYEAERIARTELGKAANTARLQGYKGRVEKVEWVLGPAYGGGCACGDYAGVHTVEEAETLPMGSVHPNCDCYWVPIVDELPGDDEEQAA